MHTAKWNTIEYPHGPYIPALHPPDNYGTAVLIDKRTDDVYSLTPAEQEIAMLFASKLIDKDSANAILGDRVYVNNFWATFKHPSRLAFEDVDWSDVIEHVESQKWQPRQKEDEEMKRIRQRRQKHGRIIVNGKEQMLNVYSVPPVSIHYGSATDPQRGKVKRGILPEDIVLNLSLELDPPHPEYHWKGLVERKDQLWVARWKDPITGQKNRIDINPPQGALTEMPEEEEEEEEEAAAVGELQEGEEREISGYEDEPEEEGSRLIDAEDIVGIVTDTDEDEEDDEGVQSAENRLAMEDYTQDELEFLPMSFLRGPLDQWIIMDRACRSGFRIVDDMAKVIDKYLKTFVDAAVYAVREKGITSPTHEAIIQYGEQRKLF